MSRLSTLLFKLVCVAVSLPLLVLSLLGFLKLEAAEHETELINKELAALREETRLMQAEQENRMSLSELERYAMEELGMQRLSPGQIIYIELG